MILKNDVLNLYLFNVLEIKFKNVHTLEHLPNLLPYIYLNKEFKPIDRHSFFCDGYKYWIFEISF